MSNLYEVSFLCISKEECDEQKKSFYKKVLAEIFQNGRCKYNYEIKNLVIKDPNFKTIKSTIQLYRKLNEEEVKEKVEKNKELEKEKEKGKETYKEKEKDKEAKKEIEKKKQKEKIIEFCSLNKEKYFSNIYFCDSIGKFFDKSLYFVKYISNKNISSILGETKVIEIARCGHNMEKILKDMGYAEENNPINQFGFFYQYKYYPIIGIYGIIQSEKYIFLQIKGYYTENNKDEIKEKLKELINQLKDLFYIKN